MRDAKVGKRVVVAGPEAPEVAQCPACGGEVRLRKRKNMDGEVSWFYRHKQGTGRQDCPRRYQPMR